MVDITTTINQILEFTKQYETSPSWALALKLGEECGEVNEAVLKDYGFLQHKQLKEDVFHEAADVINVLIGLLVTHYPNLTTEEIGFKLNEALTTKGAKYKRVIKND